MTTFQKRRGTKAQWLSINPILAAGEPAYETDTGAEKTGNGVSAYADLEYILGEAGVQTLISAVTGDLATLSTTAKSTLVAAINEAAQTGGSASVPPATESVSGVGETATVEEMLAGTDHTNKYATPLGVQAVRTALKSEILGGAGPAFDTLNELKALIDSADETDEITALTTQVGLKANLADVYSKTDIGAFASLTTSAKNSLVAAINEVNAKQGSGGTYTPVPATETVAGVGEAASFAEMAAGTDHSNKFATPAGVRQERAALKAEILGGAGPAFDTLSELKTLIDAAEETSTIDALTTQVGLKANSTDVGTLSSLTTTAKTNLVAAINEIKGSTSGDVVKSLPGLGGFIIVRDGIDTPTGDPRELIISADTTDGAVSGGIGFPPGLDVLGGQVACTLGDPAQVVTPASGDGEANGTVLIANAGTRVSARFTMQDVVLNKITWMTTGDSGAAVSGTIGIAKPDGTILRQTTMNLTPNAPTATVGDTMVWTLAGAAGTLTGPLTDADLNVGDELVIFTQHATGQIKFFARGLANTVNPDTVTRTTGTLHRSGAITTGAGAISSPLAFGAGSGYTKKPIPFFLFSRTI